MLNNQHDPTIVVLTYDAPHRKTEDVIWRLVLSGYLNLHIVATPWVDRPQRKFIYPHRPGELGWPCEPSMFPSEVALSVGAKFTRITDQPLESVLGSVDPECVVVGGAQLLPDPVVSGYKVLNVHPGLLPMCRGLDILKWSIIDGLKVGVTAHLCDSRPDLGLRICDAVVQVYRDDTFHSFAMRQYEMENRLIPEALNRVITEPKEAFEEIPESFDLHGTSVTSESRRRMPRRIESGLMPAFEKYKLIYAI